MRRGRRTVEEETAVGTCLLLLLLLLLPWPSGHVKVGCLSTGNSSASTCFSPDKPSVPAWIRTCQVASELTSKSGGEAGNFSDFRSLEITHVNSGDKGSSSYVSSKTCWNGCGSGELSDQKQPSILPESTSSFDETQHDRKQSFGREESNFRGLSDERQDQFTSNVAVRVVGEVSGELIVRFTTYKLASDHKKALEEALKGDGWKWIDRCNPASAFPTDFALIRIEPGAGGILQRQLKGLSFVKDFSPQSRFSRAIMTEERDDTSNVDQGRATATRCETVDVVVGGVEEGNLRAWLDTDLTESRGQKINSAQNSDSDRIDASSSARHGKIFTGGSLEGNSWESFLGNFSIIDGGRKILLQRSQVTSMFGAERLWAKGFSGSKVKMAVFDTGIRADHPHFKNIKERTNWTNEDTLNDNLGHGTFVAGVIASQDPQCLGFAPDAEIYAYRVFTDAQVSYTSWFLDAFNYAIATRMNVLNLSIGGPDYLDLPFVEKVWEMTANNIIMVSAIGNDGPLYGTLNNPADQSDVIGVGGIDYSDHIASFSSRGMSTWEIPHGYGRVKPDIVAYGRDIISSKISTGCKSLSGTSVASPVVAGAVCLLASVIPDTTRWEILNPASMKQALVEGAARLVGPNMFEQGAGRLDLLESYEILINYKPRASIIPQSLDFVDCPYAWPFCRQPLYAGAMPVIFNATILNGMGVVGYMEESPLWQPSNETGNLLDIRFTFSDVIWPWSGYLGLHMQIRDEGINFSGVIEGNVTLTVVSPPGKGEQRVRKSKCVLPVRLKIIPTPPRKQRILWDQFHNVRYPPGYIPRDSLDVRNDILDWHGDHPHTNFHGMFDMLRDAGYFLEILGSPLTCFDARQYGTLLMVDLEDEYYKEEIEKIEHDVKSLGLGLVVFADWYHVETMIKMKFFDDNTRSWWTPVTGGANIPALNNLLKPFNITFGDTILNGPYFIDGERGFYASGTNIIRFPSGGFLHHFSFQESIGGSPISSLQTSPRAQVEAAVLGAVNAGNGRVAVFGDSNCLDSSHMVTNCYWLLKKLLEFTSYGVQDPLLFSPSRQLSSPFIWQEGQVPVRRHDVNFSMHSSVLNHELQCRNDARFEVQNSRGYIHSSRSLLPQRQPMGSDSSKHEILDSLPLVFSNSSIQYPKTMKTGSDSELKHAQNFFKKIEELARTGVEDDVMDSELNDTHVTSDTRNRGAFKQKELEIVNSNRGQQNKIGLHFEAIGWMNHDELDVPILLVVHWVVPAVLCATGFILIFAFWRMRQKRHRRSRKGPTRPQLPL